MRRFVLGSKKLGLERRFGSQFVTRADDLVILCRRGKAEEALQRMRELMGKPKLMVALDRRHQHESKRRIGGRKQPCRSRDPLARHRSSAV